MTRESLIAGILVLLAAGAVFLIVLRAPDTFQMIQKGYPVQGTLVRSAAGTDPDTEKETTLFGFQLGAAGEEAQDLVTVPRSRVPRGAQNAPRVPSYGIPTLPAFTTRRPPARRRSNWMCVCPETTTSAVAPSRRAATSASGVIRV